MSLLAHHCWLCIQPSILCVSNASTGPTEYRNILCQLKIKHIAEANIQVSAGCSCHASLQHASKELLDPTELETHYSSDVGHQRPYVHDACLH